MKKIILAFTLSLLFAVSLFAFVSCGEQAENIPDESNKITLDITETELSEGESQRLSVTFEENGAGDELYWYSDNEDIVYVSQSGRITAVSAGVAYVTAVCGSASANCKVSVKGVEISLNEDEVTLDMITQKTFRLIASCDGAGLGGLTWSSENTSVAVVDSEGTVSAVGTGTTYVKVMSGSSQALCKVTVTMPEGYVLLEKGNNATVMENPGKWYYHGSYAGTFGYTHDGEITLSAINKNSANGDYLRYRPADLASGKTYNVSFSALCSRNGYLRISGQSTVYKEVQAGVPISIKLFL